MMLTSRVNLRTSFCNSRYGSGKTRLGNILFDKEYIKHNKERILVEAEKMAKETDILIRIDKILSDSQKPNIIQKLLEGSEKNAMSTFKAIFERIMGFFLHFFSNLKNSRIKKNFNF